MPIVTPVFRDNITVVSPTFLTKSVSGLGDILTVRDIVDLRSSYSAMFYVAVFCHDYDVIPNESINISFRRIIYDADNLKSISHPVGINRQSRIFDPDGGFLLTAATIGDTDFDVTGEGHVQESTVAIYNPSVTPQNLEFVKVIRNDSPTIYVDSPLQYGLGTGRIAKLAEVFPPCNVQGGSFIEVVVDISALEPSIWGVRVLCSIYDGDRVI